MEWKKGDIFYRVSTDCNGDYQICRFIILGLEYGKKTIYRVCPCRKDGTYQDNLSGREKKSNFLTLDKAKKIAIKIETDEYKKRIKAIKEYVF